MKKNRIPNLTNAEANVAVHQLLAQWQINAQELAKRSTNNPRARNLLQSLNATFEACDSWFDLPGETQIIVAYQPAFNQLVSDDDEDTPF